MTSLNQTQYTPSHPVLAESLIFDPSILTDSSSSAASQSSPHPVSSTSSPRAANSTTYDKYQFSTDEAEHARHDLQQHMWRLTLHDELWVAPVDPASVKHVLDCGTGSGLWPVEVAEKFPEAKVIGMDVNPISRPKEKTPSNCEYVVGDFNADWTWVKASDASFDLIHSRLILMGVMDWSAYLDRCMQHLRPGGWLEIVEITPPILSKNPKLEHLTEDNESRKPFGSNLPPAMHWTHMISAAATQLGRDMQVIEKLEGMLVEKGFKNVKRYKHEQPVGPWPVGEKEKELGRMSTINQKEFAKSVGTKMFEMCFGCEEGEMKRFLEEVDRDMDDATKGYYWRYSVFVAQRPLGA